MHTAWPKRLLWLIALWGGSVLTLAAISLLFRLLMTAARAKSLRADAERSEKGLLHLIFTFA
ncbi:Protein of uncharacterised function (DUF2474) [Klebsiella pneumoniae]|uniref:Protein of uncharacterized function (DUF2474) n=1 Tax=Klebsiella pneumoniae TaxID=573 RepID=A0A447S8U5_KLEPN|nr:Protein of uncharacterised function (DUF2474) [Klebsiella pneumoniae]